MKALHMIAFVLVVVGGLNWGLVGAFEFNLVTKLLGSWPMIETIVYVLVGLSALLLAFTHKSDCKTCESKPMQTSM
jgi:uncharacterized membrane protein YuzA (DUF378 family)